MVGLVAGRRSEHMTETERKAAEVSRLAQITFAAMRVGAVFAPGVYADNVRAITDAPPSMRRHTSSEAHFDAGRDAYRDGFGFSIAQHPEWRRGWITQQREQPRDRTAWQDLGKQP